MKHILMILLFLGIYTANAQDFYWKKQFGSTDNETAPTIVSDSNQNVYVGVSFAGTSILGDSTFTAFGEQDLAIVKLDEEGEFLKAIHFGGTGNDVLSELRIDDNGNLYAIGSSDGMMFNGTIQVSEGGEDIFVAKWNDELTAQWMKLGGSSLDDRGNAISIDAAGNIYFTGFIRSSATFEGLSLTNLGNTDIVLGKIRNDGALAWLRNDGGTTWDAGFALEMADSQHFIAGGEFINSANISGVSLTSSTGGNDESWIAKFDTSGSAIWAVKATNTGFNAVQGLAVDQVGNVYATGYFEGSTDFEGDTVLVSQGGRDAYLVKYSASGDFIWARSAGSTGFDMAMEVISDGEDKLHLVGMFEETLFITPDDSIVSNGSRDMMMIAVSSDGELNWHAGLGGAGLDAGIGLSTDDEGRIYASGYFENTMMVDGQLFNSNGGYDVFAAKISPCVFPVMNLGPMVEQDICDDTELGITLFNTEQGVLYTVYANGDSADSEVQGLIELHLEVGSEMLDLGPNDITFSAFAEGCADEVELDTTYIVDVHDNPDADFTHLVVAGQSELTDESTCDDLIVAWEWDIEGTMETTQDVTLFLTDGDYDVCLTAISEYGCVGEVCETISVLTGIEEYGAERLDVRYNATTQMLNWNYQGSLSVEIYDLNGKLVISQSVNNSLDVSALQPQVYVFKILDNNHMLTTGKLLK